MLHKQTGSIHNDLMISVICKQKYPTIRSGNLKTLPQIFVQTLSDRNLVIFGCMHNTIIMWEQTTNIQESSGQKLFKTETKLADMSIA